MSNIGSNTKLIAAGSVIPAVSILGYSGYLMKTLQQGRNTSYVLTASSNTVYYPYIASGGGGTFSSSVFTGYVAIITAIVPPTACKIKGHLGWSGGSSSYVGIAPNANYSGYSSINPPPCVCMIDPSGYWSTSAFEFMLESMNLYYASDEPCAYY